MDGRTVWSSRWQKFILYDAVRGTFWWTTPYCQLSNWHDYVLSLSIFFFLCWDVTEKDSYSQTPSPWNTLCTLFSRQCSTWVEVSWLPKFKHTASDIKCLVCNVAHLEQNVCCCAVCSVCFMVLALILQFDSILIHKVSLWYRLWFLIKSLKILNA